MRGIFDSLNGNLSSPHLLGFLAPPNFLLFFWRWTISEISNTMSFTERNLNKINKIRTWRNLRKYINGNDKYSRLKNNKSRNLLSKYACENNLSGRTDEEEEEKQGVNGCFFLFYFFFLFSVKTLFYCKQFWLRITVHWLNFVLINPPIRCSTFACDLEWVYIKNKILYSMVKDYYNVK